MHRPSTSGSTSAAAAGLTSPRTREETKRQLVASLKKQFPDLAEAEINKLVDQFQKSDRDGNGKIDKDEFAHLITEMKKGGSAVATIDRMLMDLHFSAADKDRSAGLDIVEFISAYESLLNSERDELVSLVSPSFPDLTPKQIAKVLEAFEKFDKDGDGVLDKDEFYQLKEELAPSLSKVLLRLQSEHKFDHLDKDGSGEISEAELLNAYHEVFGSKSGSHDTAAATVSAHKVWDDFVAADTLLGTRQRFEELKEVCGVRPGDDVYEGIKDKVKTHTRYTMFWQLLDKKKKSKDYVLKSAEKPRVLIVGAGPGGLRAAIEILLLGAKVVVVEKRGKFTRHNLLHIWNASIRDLKNIGAKFLYPQFCVGGIDHISIRRLQTVLLKVALLFGAKFIHGSFVNIAEPVLNAGNPNSVYWKATIQSRETVAEEDLYFNVLVGAEGEHSAVGQKFGFEKKTFKGSEAIGITANFVNAQSAQEKQLREFGLLAVYNQPFFAEFKNKYDIELENLVYYRDETHYFVMTAKRGSLLRKGVAKQDRPAGDIAQPDNIDHAKLESFVREVATQVGLPPESEFMKNSRGAKDVAIFDFSKKQQCVQPAKIVGTETTQGTLKSKKLLVALVGDALVEPFWPQGTGANRAILSALDTAWIVKTYHERCKTPDDESKLLAEWNADFRVMVTSSPEDLQNNFGAATIDPRTRYKRNLGFCGH